MPTHLRFKEDLDTYEPSDSEDEYTEKQKQLLSKVRNRKKKYSDSEDEVFGVGSNDEDDDQSDLAPSDIDGQGGDDDSLPDVRAWGKDRNKYYQTDYVDPDYGGFQGKDAHLAELEEEEAQKLQRQLAQQLDEDDFALDILPKEVEQNKTQAEDTTGQTEELIKTDLSKLSKREKLQLLQRESPEFSGLVQDFEVKMKTAKDYLHPVLQKFKKGQIPQCEATEFVQTQYKLILSYCTNIYMYLLLKSSRVNLQSHPVIKRLYQYRQLFAQLDPIYEEIVKPQIELILEDSRNFSEDVPKQKSEKKTLKLLSALAKKVDEPAKKKKRVTIVEEPISKKIKLNEKEKKHKAEVDDPNTQLDSSDDNEQEQDTQQVEQGGEQEITKRAITYKMAKNKGLTPHRKKEQRNPRVKHRLKYRKAIIRRKGAVREPRKELTRYSGEISGIKASVSKSIKIKT